MTPPITLTLAILLAAVLLFVSERLRVDLVALLVLAALALAGLVTPAEAVSGFSNPAVVTVWAVFILSGGLTRTGVANLVGNQVLRLGGRGEVRLMIVIMLTAGLMSAFMNNVGVAAMMLPVVLGICRRTGISRSRMLMPLAFGSLLGGLTTLIGTPPNILASDALREFGLRPFGLFDFAPVGVVVALAGTAYMILIGRRLLSSQDISRTVRSTGADAVGEVFDLQDRLLTLQLPPDTALEGQTLADSRIGSALGLNVVGILHNGNMRLAPGPDSVLHAGDRLLVAGGQEHMQELLGRRYLRVEDEEFTVENLTSTDIHMAELVLLPQFPHLGTTLPQIDFRSRYGGMVLAIWRDGQPLRTDLDGIELQAGDTLLVQSTSQQLEQFKANPDLQVSTAEHARIYRLHERLLAVRIPEGSTLAGKSLAESRLADAFGLAVLGILRAGETMLMISAEERFKAGDQLLVKGKPEVLSALEGLQNLEVDAEAPPELVELETDEVGLVEMVLSPHTTLVGKTLRELHFREKYGVSVLSIWREGQAYHTDLSDMPLQFGDALLLFGPRDRLRLVGSEPDFLPLTDEIQEAPRLERAPVASLIMLAVVLSVLVGWLPISIAAVAGSALMVLTGCLSMEEAYRFIDWRAVFLIAGMLPLGIAMETSGTASFLAETLMAQVAGMGPIALMFGLFALTNLASQIMPNPVVTVLMAPIAINAAINLDLSPFALMMVVALAASASFLSPVGHPANVLVMGPGGYRFTDYVRVGLPLSLVVMAITLLVVPIFWPL